MPEVNDRCLGNDSCIRVQKIKFRPGYLTMESTETGDKMMVTQAEFEDFIKKVKYGDFDVI